MSGTGLANYGIVASTIVRRATRDQEGLQICSECGHPVGSSQGSHRIHFPDLVDGELRRLTNELIVFGWRCDQHPYEVVMPARAGGPDAPARPGDWIGVQLVFADEEIRWVPTPKPEIDRLLEGSA